MLGESHTLTVNQTRRPCSVSVMCRQRTFLASRRHIHFGPRPICRNPWCHRPSRRHAQSCVPNRAQSKSGFCRRGRENARVCEAFAEGLNYYLATHPEVKPRLIDHFEGWHVLALNRHIFMDFMLMIKYLPRSYMGKDDPSFPKPIGGSNAWAIGPSRTKNGSTILFCNPHQPGFGYSQLYEAHLRSGDGWDFTGERFGSPLPGMGTTRYLGWTHTVNQPDKMSISGSFVSTIPPTPTCIDLATNTARRRHGQTNFLSRGVANSKRNRKHSDGRCMVRSSQN